MAGAANRVDESKDLQVHHIEARSHLGDDSEQNLITLCADCHRGVHGKR